jgi:hypothetical protein
VGWGKAKAEAEAGPAAQIREALVTVLRKRLPTCAERKEWLDLASRPR